MPILRDLKILTPNQRNAVLASFLGWTLDAFDFFIIVFVLKDIAKEFKTDIPSVTATLFLTLAMRPLGAFLFGIMADRYGRRPTLMVNIMLYSVFELLSGFAPSLTALVILRGLYGVAMGGEWGVGASLTECLSSARFLPYWCSSSEVMLRNHRRGNSGGVHKLGWERPSKEGGSFSSTSSS
jgi:SHS family lactate transporter-like MFS transporter